ncbi:hypothetical protein [Streptomyces boncukensis]|uniref:Uncharacterized protein n=1 Tax=Streptomyces boncukensis TaxID=2711219 RepID=A0A6G4X823_9ACTN|nr:hypothetical protein [Streptomyces boncukensis]NGO73000.1 hypothetical protein [Streptomyces boncukensis]
MTGAEGARARTYYRNATSGELRLVVTLLRPDGRATEVRCAMPATNEPRLCETPPGAGRAGGAGRPGGAYSAVAEVASADGERLLLRAGSNSPARSRT